MAPAANAGAFPIAACRLHPSRVPRRRSHIFSPYLSSSWKPRYYLALIFWNSDQIEKAGALFEACGNDPDYPAFYLARGDFYSRTDFKTAQSNYLRALELDPHTWRTGYRVARFYLTNGKQLEASGISEEYFQRFPENYYLGLQYADLLNKTGQYERSINTLKNLTVLPNEGATSGRMIWHESNLRKAVQSIIRQDFQTARDHIDLALEWPENLGVGKPYNVDERLENLLLVAIDKFTGREEELSADLQKIIDFPLSEILSVEDFITAWTLKITNRNNEADQIMKRFENQPNNIPLQWCLAIYNGKFILAEEILEKTKYDSQTGRDLTLDLLIQLHKNSDIFQ